MPTRFQAANAIRALAMDAVQKANAGHPGMPMGMADIAEEQLAEIAVATRKWATLNPAATMRDAITIADVMNSTKISDPLKLLDCCLVTDGAGAVVMTTAENARAHGAKAIHVRGYGEAHTHWSIGAMPDLARLTAAEMSSKRAFEMAGVGHDAIDVVECYDSFTITVLDRKSVV